MLCTVGWGLLSLLGSLWYDACNVEGSLVKRYGSHLTALGLYSLLALLLTWPLVTQLTTHIPGSAAWAFDESTFVWNMWWFKFSLLNLGQSPLHTGHIFYPLGIDLVLYTFNFFNAMLGLPLQMVFPLPLASNLTILCAYVLSGYGGYLLVSYVLAAQSASNAKGEDAGREEGRAGRLRAAAFVAGAAYAFAASRMIYAALGHYDMVTVQWFPFYAVFLLKTVREPGYRNAILAGICATFALLAEMIFGVFLLFLTLFLLVGELGRAKAAASGPHRQRPGLRLSARLVVLCATVAILWSPVMVPILRAFAAGDFALDGWGEGLKLSADLVGWITPTPLHPLLGVDDWSAHLRSVVEGNAPFLDVNTVFLGYGILALALVGVLSAWRQVKAWAWSAAVFAAFTLGPLLQVKGRFLFPLDNLLREQGLAQDVTFPMPFVLLHYIPIIKANRAPNRFSVVLSLALAVLVGYGVLALLRRLPGVRGRAVSFVAVCVMMGIVLFDQVSIPLPLTDARVPRPYATIAAQGGDFAILQFPLGWRNSFGTQGAERTQLQYYQTQHHKRMLAGNISRAPDFKFDYFGRIPLFRALTETELYREVDDETMTRARAQADELMALYDVRYLVVHGTIPLRYPYVDTMGATQDLAFSLLPLDSQPVVSGDGAAVYRIAQPPVPDTVWVDFGDWTSAPYRGEGWSDDEDVFAASANWAVGTEARVFFPVRGAGERYLSMQIAPFAYPGAPSQTVSLSVNDERPFGRILLAEGWQIIGVTLPGPALREGLNTLTLRFDHAVRPSTVLPGNTDDRPLAGAVDWMEVGVER